LDILNSKIQVGLTLKFILLRLLSNNNNFLFTF